MFTILFWFIVLANLGGFIYGTFFFYSGQFLSTNPLLWIFVPDCPLAALLIGLAFLSRCGSPNLSFLHPFSRGKSYDLSWFWFLAFVMAMKYGFWTVFVLATYSSFYFTPSSSLLYSILFASHIFLFFETFLLVGKIRPKRWFLVPSLGFLLLNDLSDYLLGTHPPLPEASLGFMFPATIFMTLAFTGLSYHVLRSHMQEQA
jgi:uncharacterized membrane protein YpjA